MSTTPLAVEPAGGTTIQVYSGTIRLWHWLNALCIVVLVATGLLIAYPPQSVGGEASAHFLLGYIRFVHFAAGYVLACAFVLRIVWAIFGDEHARELLTLPIGNAAWRDGFVHQIRWYLMIDKKSRKFIGHNPLAHVAMLCFLIALLLMIVTGLALYSEGAGVGSWQDTLFGWVIPFLGGSQATHSWHHLGMWGVVVFVTIHVYAAIREEIMSRQTMLSAIISGTRTFRD